MRKNTKQPYKKNDSNHLVSELDYSNIDNLPYFSNTALIKDVDGLIYELRQDVIKDKLRFVMENKHLIKNTDDLATILASDLLDENEEITLCKELQSEFKEEDIKDTKLSNLSNDTSINMLAELEKADKTAFRYLIKNILNILDFKELIKKRLNKEEIKEFLEKDDLIYNEDEWLSDESDYDESDYDKADGNEQDRKKSTLNSKEKEHQLKTGIDLYFAINNLSGNKIEFFKQYAHLITAPEDLIRIVESLLTSDDIKTNPDLRDNLTSFIEKFIKETSITLELNDFHQLINLKNKEKREILSDEEQDKIYSAAFNVLLKDKRERLNLIKDIKKLPISRQRSIAKKIYGQKIEYAPTAALKSAINQEVKLSFFLLKNSWSFHFWKFKKFYAVKLQPLLKKIDQCINSYYKDKKEIKEFSIADVTDLLRQIENQLKYIKQQEKKWSPLRNAYLAQWKELYKEIEKDLQTICQSQGHLADLFKKERVSRFNKNNTAHSTSNSILFRPADSENCSYDVPNIGLGR